MAPAVTCNDTKSPHIETGLHIIVSCLLFMEIVFLCIFALPVKVKNMFMELFEISPQFMDWLNQPTAEDETAACELPSLPTFLSRSKLLLPI